jgi:hypothetical protein
MASEQVRLRIFSFHDVGYFLPERRKRPPVLYLLAARLADFRK